LVARGTEVHVSQEFELKLHHEEYKDQTNLSIELYATTAQDAILCDEPGVIKVGTIKIDVPESWHNQFMNLVLFFGQMEIRPFINNENGEFLKANLELEF
jgi:hypothetical protein